jgi:hypothetical protein
MVMFGMQFGIDLQSFVESIDPIKHFQTLATLLSGSFIASKSKRKEQHQPQRLIVV